MIPVIFSLGPVTFYSLSFLSGIGFFLAAFIIWRRLRDLGFDEEKIIDFILFSALLGLGLGKLIHFLAVGNFSGFVFGGVIAGTAFALLIFCKRKHWNFWQVADEIVFGLLPLSVLFQVGLFLDGSSPGRPTGMPWGVYFPDSLVRSQPVSVFLAIALFFIWLFLLKIERQWRTWEWYQSKNSGFLALVFLGLTSMVNFLVAFWRHSGIYWYWAEVTLSFLGLAGASWLLYLRSGKKVNKKIFRKGGY